MEDREEGAEAGNEQALKPAGEGPEEGEKKGSKESKNESSGSSDDRAAMAEEEGWRQKIEELEKLFDGGNFAELRRQADWLSRQRMPEDLQKQLEEILDRIEVDSVALWIGAGCLLLIGLLFAITLG